MKIALMTSLKGVAAAALAAGLSGPALADAIDDAARAEFLATTVEVCTEALQVEPEVYRVTFRYPGEPATVPARDARIYKFFCFSGAYTVIDVYYIHTEIEGLTQAFFAVPEFRVDCTPPDALECRRARVVVTGVATVGELANTEFDPATLTLRSRGCWRGPCDAFSEGVWVFEGGRFVLRLYDVDATYDGNQTPVRLVDFTTPR